MSRVLRDALLSTLEFLILLLLWMMFVSKISWQEFGIGVLAAIAGAIGDAVVKAEGLALFKPKPRWVLLIFSEPWYVLKGTVLVFRELARVCTGRQPWGGFQSVPFRYGGSNEVASGRRALFAAYTTISPDTIVVGLDRDQHIALLHQLGSREVPELADRLGANP